MEPSDTQSQPVESSKSKMPIFSSLLFLVIIAVAGYFFLIAKPKISGLEVAEKTASFLSKTFLPDGRMLGGFKCDPSEVEKCTPYEVSPVQPHVGQAIYSFFNLAEVTGNQWYREKSDKAINSVLDRCDKDKKICEWNYFPLAHYYEKTKEEKYLTRGMLPPSEQFLTMPTYDAIIGNVGHKLASLYNATGDIRFKNRLIEIADEEIAKGNSTDPFVSMSAVWSVYLPLYKITNNLKYLIAAEDFFDTHEIMRETNFEPFKNLGITQVSLKGVDGLLGLAEISKKKEAYRAQAHTVLQEAIYKLWDTPEALKFDGDYGFLDTPLPDDLSTISEANDNRPHKSTLLNGWMTKLFTLMKDDKFELPK